MGVESERFRNVCRYSLIIINSIVCAGGLVLVGAGIYLLVDKSDLVSGVMFVRLAKPATSMIIAVGAFSFITGFFGILGALRENIILHIIYMVVIVCIGILAIVAGIFAIAYKAQYNGFDWIRQAMRESIQLRYGVDVENNTRNAYETYMWDQAQQKWYCCGAEDNSWGIYRGSIWYDRQPGEKENLRPLVPPSCCVTDQYGKTVNLQKCQTWMNGPPKLASGAFNEGLFYQGCYTFGLTLLHRIASGVIAMGLIMGILLIVALIMSLGLLIYMCKTKDKPAQYMQDTQPNKPAVWGSASYSKSYA